MQNSPILAHLKKHGQLLDSEIAAGMGLPLPAVQESISELVAQGEISSCRVTRFLKGKPVEGIQCRIRGFAPPAAPGRKPAAK